MISPATRNIAGVITASLASSIIGGALSMYVAFRVLEERMAVVDGKVRDQAAELASVRLTFEAFRAAGEGKNESIRNEIARIAADMAYVRGVIETDRRVRAAKE